MRMLPLHLNGLLTGLYSHRRSHYLFVYSYYSCHTVGLVVTEVAAA